MVPIDIFITCYHRWQFTQQTITYLYERTTHPFRLFVIDNGGNELILNDFVKQGKVFLVIRPSANIGIHASWNLALAMAESEYFITSDNDIWVPDLRSVDEHWNPDFNTIEFKEKEGSPDWLTRMIKIMDKQKGYGAISLHPHIIIGDKSEDPNDPDEVKEVGHCGAVMRIMRTEVVRSVGGWDHAIRTSRNHEEKTICGKLQEAGYKSGRTTRIRAYHPFGKENGGNWGYPQEITPEMQGHNPALKEEVLRFDNKDSYDERTWLPK